MRKTKLLLTSILSAGLLLSACGPTGETTLTKAEMIETHSQALNEWFQARYEDGLARSPMTQTYLGIKDNQDKLDDVSQLADDETAALSQAWLEDMRRDFDIDRLDKQTALSYRLYEFATEDGLASHKFAGNEYVFQHMSGPHSNLPSFMINFHKVEDHGDAWAYIARLNDFPRYLGQYEQKARAQADNGVVLPKFVYAKISEAARNVISGAPFEESETDSPLWADIKSKIDKATGSEAEKGKLKDEAKTALLTSVQPAYLNLLNMFAEHEKGATKDDGTWKLPNADDYYAARLHHYTTTDMTAEEIHETGLKEVARIQDEMREIMKQVKFEGTLKEFFGFLRSDPQFVFPNDDTGRESYISEATEIIDDMKGRLDSLFITKPKADIIVKRVEPFREATAFGAFYNQPAIDGSRPGTYYINLKDVADQPKYLMQALAYHEGIPGHHMQIAIGNWKACLNSERWAVIPAILKAGRFIQRPCPKNWVCTRTHIKILDVSLWRYSAPRGSWLTRVFTQKNGHANKPFNITLITSLTPKVMFAPKLTAILFGRAKRQLTKSGC